MGDCHGVNFDTVRRILGEVNDDDFSFNKATTVAMTMLKNKML